MVSIYSNIFCILQLISRSMMEHKIHSKSTWSIFTDRMRQISVLELLLDAQFADEGSSRNVVARCDRLG